MALGIFLLQGPREALFLMSEDPCAESAWVGFKVLLRSNKNRALDANAGSHPDEYW